MFPMANDLLCKYSDSKSQNMSEYIFFFYFTHFFRYMTPFVRVRLFLCTHFLISINSNYNPQNKMIKLEKRNVRFFFQDSSIGERPTLNFRFKSP